MFSGIVTDVGRVARVERSGDTRFTIETAYDTAEIGVGASIAHSGVCLTVVDTEPGRYAIQASAETLSRTTLGRWQTGTRVNLERSLRMGEEIGGHLVFGHVDGLARLVDVHPEGDSHRWVLEVPEDLARAIAPKGSIALDGVSLTVNETMGSRFGVNIIPHTNERTTFGAMAPGDTLNVEIDMLARYVLRALETMRQAPRP